MRFIILCVALLILFATTQAVELNIVEKKISVNGREASVYAIAQQNETLGLRINKGQEFEVLLKNNLELPTSVHWHGLILPNAQDGVAFITQFPIYPLQSYQYNFPVVQSGTFWMHSHLGLQEQKLLSAPLIIYEPEDREIADQEVIIFLADFSFTPPSSLYENLRCKNVKSEGVMSVGNMKMDSYDIVDVDYDAFLTNYRTLDNPEIIEVNPSKKIRLRIINGASGTNFWINLGDLSGQAIAVDGNRIIPFKDNRFELAVAQRIDILIEIPQEGGAFPILAIGEGTNEQTGLVLITKNAIVPKLVEKTSEKAPALSNIQETKLQALYPLEQKVLDKTLFVELGGNMSTYVWTINGQAWPESTPLIVKKGERVEIVFKNSSTMSHPMHLHGHVFQVKGIDGKAFEGAMRDTVLVMPNSSLNIQFDANNPGVWPLHCHILYHMEAGMFTVVRYSDFVQSL